MGYDSTLFCGTYEYYAKYRPNVPEEVVQIIIEQFDIKPVDRVLDIGCGTCQMAIAMNGKCNEMVCLDSDLEMLKQAKRELERMNLKQKIVLVNCYAEDLIKRKNEFEIFKLVTICRAFHWMDQNKVLTDLDSLISEDGGIAIISDGSFWTGEEEWQNAVKKVVQKYLGKERRAGKGTFKESPEPWENIISRSAFSVVESKEVEIVRTWTVESIIGWLFSSSFASPKYFGNKIEKFKKDINETLLLINPDGVFNEHDHFNLILASRPRK
ncbi:class I SAM-dependent methyltransferase [Methanosarcina sp. KYL-1]|uniref:class I SAM-dependent methyltransferase n=1 Tax=Methanosarcina sp. KYL-1 TaxID=2602068 RepID=UPI00210104D5|nr:class I SAM-dependent methyltransferase [Methanosarcina sp. KYL-1]MCQ1535728.1 class I SAM-dependent methyltransferase [Methanosarcina sp. KYL-1]